MTSVRFTRREFLAAGAVAGAGMMMPLQFGVERAMAAQTPQVPLPGSAIPQFVDPMPMLPHLGVVDATGGTGPLGATQIVLNMTEFKAQVLPSTMPGYTGTWVWGYLPDGQTSRSTYLGPIVLAQRGVPVEFKFVNKLGGAASTNVLAYKYGTDQTLHWADPLNGEANMWNHMAMPPAQGSEGAENYLGPIPACVHLHGGEVPPVLDGGPDAWFTNGPINYQGHGFYSADGAAATNYSIYRYPNTQEGAPIWFHDHTLGATRLNVFCGLAGGYLILDPANDPTNLPEGPVPLIIQDRMFDTNGQLFFPSDTAGGLQWALNPEHPYWVPEFVGDTICVNGRAWPFMNVTPKRYWFLFLNGSNARTYEMQLIDPVSKNPGPDFWMISTDGAYLDAPVKVGPSANTKLVMMPGERYMAIIDFAGYEAGVIGPNGLPYSGVLLLKNTAKAPYPAGAAVQGSTTGRILQFRVGGPRPTDTSFDPKVPGATLRGGAGQGPAIVRLVNPTTGTVAAGVTVHKTRQLTLNEVMGMPQMATNPVTGLATAYPGGPLEILVNNTKWTGERIVGVDSTDPTMPMYMMEPIPGFTLDGAGRNYLSETPKEGETEVWEIINLTADAHPIHTHLVQFQLMNRQALDVAKYNAAYAAAFPGGGWDPMANAPYAAGVYIPGFGPPMAYGTGAVVGGNPDVDAKSAKGKSLYLQGPATPPLPHEAGWKDVVVALPGQVTRFVVRWAPTDLPANTLPANANFAFDPNGGAGYVWHCHIVDHEDNEMMRPDEVVANAVTRSYVKGVDY